MSLADIALYLLPPAGAIIVALGSYRFRQQDQRVDEHDKILVRHGERLSAVEAVLPKIDKQLDRIEDKIDGYRST